MELIGKTNIDFIGMRKISFIISGIITIIGLIGIIQIGRGAANMGIDFAGGVMLQGHFDKPVAIDDLRSALTSTFPDAAVTSLTDFHIPNAFLIKTKKPNTESEGREEATTLKNLLAQMLCISNFWRVYSLIRWATSIPASGRGTWAMGLYLAPWLISWLQS